MDARKRIKSQLSDIANDSSIRLLPHRIAPALRAANLTVVPKFAKHAHDRGPTDSRARSRHVGVAERRREMPDAVDHHLALRATARPHLSDSLLELQVRGDQDAV